MHTPRKSTSDRWRTILRRFLIISTVTLLPAILYYGARGGHTAQDLAVLAIALLTAHAVLLLGAIPVLAFASICLTVTFAVENLSIGTGFPFGHYRFLFGQNLVHIGAVPIIIGPTYFVLCYQSWIIASLIADDASGEARDAVSFISVPIVAAFTMTQWDLVAEPPNATVARNWIWPNGGGFLGVPLSNFLGWFLTTWIVFQLFQLFQLFNCRWRGNIRVDRRGPLCLMLPILTYMVSGLAYLMPPFPTDRMIADGSGHVWSSAAIRTVAETLTLFTLIPTSCFALIRLARTARPAPRQPLDNSGLHEADR